jgi:hypothetical protein
MLLPMRLLTIIYDSGIDESLTELLDALAVPGWTKLYGAHGDGGRGKRFNNPVHPGDNNLLLVALPESQVDRVVGAIHRLQAGYRLKPGITIMVQPVELGEAPQAAVAGETPHL